MGHDRFSEPIGLDGFVRYALALDLLHINPVEFFDFGNVLSLVVYRDAPWQAELITLRPGPGFPREHRHPGVDAFEYDLSFDTPFIINGRLADPSCRLAGRPLYEVRAVDWHAVGDVPQGATFLSIQQWQTRPTSVGLDWEGTPVSAKHRELLRAPASVWKKTIHRPQEKCRLERK